MSNNNNNDIPGLDNILRAIEERGTFARMRSEERRVGKECGS